MKELSKEEAKMLRKWLEQAGEALTGGQEMPRVKWSRQLAIDGAAVLAAEGAALVHRIRSLKSDMMEVPPGFARDDVICSVIDDAWKFWQAGCMLGEVVDALVPSCRLRGEVLELVKLQDPWLDAKEAVERGMWDARRLGVARYRITTELSFDLVDPWDVLAPAWIEPSRRRQNRL